MPATCRPKMTPSLASQVIGSAHGGRLGRDAPTVACGDPPPPHTQSLGLSTPTGRSRAWGGGLVCVVCCVFVWFHPDVTAGTACSDPESTSVYNKCNSNCLPLRLGAATGLCDWLSCPRPRFSCRCGSTPPRSGGGGCLCCIVFVLCQR